MIRVLPTAVEEIARTAPCTAVAMLTTFSEEAQVAGRRAVADDVSGSRGQRCKGRDRERSGRVPSGPPPHEDEQRGEQQKSGLRPCRGGVLYPRGGGAGEVGDVPIEGGAPEIHGHGP